MADEHGDEEKHAKGGHKSHGGGGGHGGGEEHEGGAPEWLISFADNVALMMGFFVILLAMNLGPKATGSSEGESTGDARQTQEMLDWAIGVREAFNNPVNGNNPNDALLWKRVLEKQSEDESKVKAPRGKDQDVTNIRKGEYSSRGGLVTFATKSAELDAEGKAAIQEILKHRRGLQNIIEVKGNASAAEAFDLADRGMDLSYRRARVVADALVAAGVEWAQIRISALADTDRVAATIYDLHGHRANQRVEIIETTMKSGPADSKTTEPAEGGNETKPTEKSPASTETPAKPPATPPKGDAGHGGH